MILHSFRYEELSAMYNVRNKSSHQFKSVLLENILKIFNIRKVMDTYNSSLIGLQGSSGRKQSVSPFFFRFCMKLNNPAEVYMMKASNK